MSGVVFEYLFFILMELSEYFEFVLLIFVNFRNWRDMYWLVGILMC